VFWELERDMVQIQKYGGARSRFNPNSFRGIL